MKMYYFYRIPDIPGLKVKSGSQEFRDDDVYFSLDFQAGY